MRNWPEAVIEVFQEADVDYDDVCDLDDYELFKAYCVAAGLDADWAEHIWTVLEWIQEKPAPGDEIPEHLGQVADEYKRVSQIRLTMSKATDEVKARESELKNFLIDNIDVDNESGVMGRNYVATIKTDKKPRMDAEFWPDLHQWIADNDRFDLLQKRLSDTAVMDLINSGEKLPGIESMTVKSVSVTKVKK
ncbi:MAG: hypothetical protein MJH10_14470 [Epibacterium sp.]|nr:hypothetical protein [Epibacterium sp.]NQX74732.1 hypothetical protein [Epibacterium sp.]